MNSGYILPTGDGDAARLALLDKVYGPDCHRILAACGVAAGMRAADLGCGTGSTTAWLAAQVGPQGEVCAVDFAPEQLSVAETRLRDAGNVRFLAASADATNLPRDTFDIVHCRLLLCHVVNPLDVVREMMALARPGGLVIVFDMDINGLQTYPPTNCFARTRDMIRQAGKVRGRDYEIGMKLPALFREAGLLRPELALIHPVHLRSEEKRLWEYSLFASQPAIVQHGVAADAEFDGLREEFAAVARDDSCVVAQTPLAACWARKP